MSQQQDTGTPNCTKPGCENPADALYSNGLFQEHRCPEHAQGDHISVVEEL